MRDNKKVYGTANLIITTVLMVGAFILGNFMDMEIMELTYLGNSPFYIWVAAYGILPGCAVFGLVSLLFLNYKDENGKRKPWAVMLHILLQGVAVVVLFVMTDENIPEVAAWIRWSSCWALVALSQLPLIKTAARADRARLTRYIVFLVCVCGISSGLAQYLKVVWARPRYRWLVREGKEYFSQWYKIDKTVRERFMALGVWKDEFKSFPSGHVQTATLTCCLSTLGYVDEKQRGKTRAIFFVSMCYTIFLAWSRHVLGAHFLTDLAAGGMISFSLLMLFSKLFGIFGWGEKSLN